MKDFVCVCVLHSQSTQNSLHMTCDEDTVYLDNTNQL